MILPLKFADTDVCLQTLVQHWFCWQAFVAGFLLKLAGANSPAAAVKKQQPELLEKNLWSFHYLLNLRHFYLVFWLSSPREQGTSLPLKTVRVLLNSAYEVFHHFPVLFPPFLWAAHPAFDREVGKQFSPSEVSASLNRSDLVFFSLKYEGWDLGP